MSFFSRKRDSSKPAGSSHVEADTDQYLNTTGDTVPSHPANTVRSPVILNPTADIQPTSQPAQGYEEVPGDLTRRTLDGSISHATDPPREYESVPRHYENQEDWNRPYAALRA